MWGYVRGCVYAFMHVCVCVLNHDCIFAVMLYIYDIFIVLKHEFIVEDEVLLIL